MLAAVLKVGPSRMDAVGIADWATVLRDQPNFYLETIAPARMALHDVDKELTAPTSFLCVAAYFSREEGWAGERSTITAPVGTRKWPRMGLPLACEFLRNLGWNGFKPDRHIIRLPVTAAHPRIGHGRNPRVPQSLCRLGDCSTRLECSTRHMLTQHPPDWVTDRPVGQLVRAKHFLYWPTSGWLSGNAID